MANLIPVITKELGVEIGEEFKFKQNGLLDGFTYRFTDKEIQSKCKGKEWGTSPIDLNIILKQEIIKLPFEPKTGDEYWTYSETWEVEDWVWTYDFLDLVYKRVGIVFRTKEEAIKARPEVYKRLTGKEWKNG